MSYDGPCDTEGVPIGEAVVPGVVDAIAEDISEVCRARLVALWKASGEGEITGFADIDIDVRGSDWEGVMDNATELARSDVVDDTAPPEPVTVMETEVAIADAVSCDAFATMATVCSEGCKDVIEDDN